MGLHNYTHTRNIVLNVWVNPSSLGSPAHSGQLSARQMLSESVVHDCRTECR